MRLLGLVESAIRTDGLSESYRSCTQLCVHLCCLMHSCQYQRFESGLTNVINYNIRRKRYALQTVAILLAPDHALEQSFWPLRRTSHVHFLTSHSRKVSCSCPSVLPAITCLFAIVKNLQFPHIPSMLYCHRARNTRSRRQYHVFEPKVRSFFDLTVPVGKNPPLRLDLSQFKATEEDLCTYLTIRLMTLTSLGHGTDEQSLPNPRNSTGEDAEISNSTLLHFGKGRHCLCVVDIIGR